MGYTVSLSDLQQACLDQSDEQGYGYIDTVQLTRMINRSWARLYGRLVQLAEDDYTEAAVITTEAGREQYELPSDFLKIRSVEAYPSGIPGTGDSLAGSASNYDPVYGSGDASDVIRLRRFDLRERPRYSGAWTSGDPVVYRTIGQGKIRFLPVPSVAMPVVVWYVPAPAVLADGDSIDARAGWDDWIVWDVCAKIAVKQEQDAATPVALRDAVWRDEIEALAGTTDEADPERVIDVEGDCVWEVW